ncbi:MAG: glycosyltransferase family 4 protein [Elusimicrobia bacterium]|nr:glycosyltransferase family 4 protein [Elusimicrobiota bacterium]
MKIAFQGCFRDPSKPYSSVWDCESNFLKALSRLDRSNEYLLFNYGLKNHAALAGRLANPGGPNFSTFVPPLSRRLIELAESAGLDPRGALLGRRGVDFLHIYEQIHAAPPRFPTIVTFLDAIAVLHPEWSAPELVAAIETNAKRAAHVIAASPWTKRQVLRLYGLPDERVSVVDFGIDHDRFRRLPPERTAPVREKFRLPRRYLFCIGPFTPRKNLEYALDAFPRWKAKHPDLALVLAGSPSPLREGFERKARERGLRDVLFVGELTHEELAAMYNMAGVFLYPSPFVGLPLLEAMACGCPVAAADTEAMPDMAGRAAAFFSLEDPDDLVAKVDRILEDEESRRRLVELGLAWAAEFTWERAARQTLEVYARFHRSLS